MMMPKRSRHKKTNSKHKESSLCDQLVLVLQPEQFERFIAMIDNRPASNPRLTRLMKTEAPWDKDRLEAIEAIREGIKDTEEGRVRDAHTALEELSQSLGFSENMK
jgi:hypothetical protein